MNQPKRWLESAPNPKISDLLRAGLTDAPGARALPRTAAALGLGTAVAVVSGSAGALAAGSTVHSTFTGSAASAAAGATAASAAGAGMATGSGSVGALLVGKWLAVGFLTGGVASAGLVASQTGFGIHSREAPRGVAPRAPAAQGAAVSSRARASANANLPTVSLDVATPPRFAPSQGENAAPAVEPSPKANANLARAVVPTAIPASTPPPAAPSEAASSGSERRGALAAEIAWIDSARRALASGDVNRSLAELDAFERTRKLGVLDREAELLRIDALRRKGDIAGARRVAQRYLGAFPGDAHAPRLREFLSSSETKH